MKNLLLTIPLLLAPSCKTMLPANQAQADELAAAHAELVTVQGNLGSAMAALRAEIEALQADGNLTTNLETQLATLMEQFTKAAEGIKAVETAQTSLKAQDAGEQTGQIIQLLTALAIAFGGGGLGAGLLQKISPSRSAAKVAELQTQLAHINGILDSFRAGMVGAQKPT